jgi:hypothetical protein
MKEMCYSLTRKVYVQGKWGSGLSEATIAETERTIQGYSNYSRGSIQIPSEYKSGWAYFVAAVPKTQNKTTCFLKTLSQFSLCF